MRISDNEVKHVARLAELEFDDKEISRITPQLDRILGHVARISALNTDDIKPASHVFDVKNVFREDIPSDSISQKEALRNAPLKKDEGFRVPRID